MEPQQSSGPAMRARWSLWVWCCAWAFVAWSGVSCRTAATRETVDPGPAVARLQAGGTIRDETDRLVQPLLEKRVVLGVAVGILTPDGATQFFSYGSAGVGGVDQPPGADSLFQVGSLSKVFLAALVERLVAEGQLRFEDTLGDIYPPTVPLSTGVAGLTVGEVLTHTAGLPREPLTLTQFLAFQRYLVTGENLYSYLTRPYLHQYLRRCEPAPPAERRFEYSNFGMGVLADLVEYKTGVPAEELIVAKICRPLNMTNSVFIPGPAQQPLLTDGHTGNQACWRTPNSRLTTWDMGEILRASTGMYSSVNDLLVFAKANLGFTHHPLSPVLRALHRQQVATPRGGEGKGWIINRFEDGRVTLTFKDGMVSGYRAYLGMELDARVAVVVLSDKFDWDDRIGHNLLLRLATYYRRGAAPASGSASAGGAEPAS